MRPRRSPAGSTTPYLLALTDLQLGYIALQCGRWPGAAEALEAAITRLESECQGAGWELTMAQVLRCEVLAETGRFTELPDFHGRALRRAERLSDLNGLQGLLQFEAEQALVADRPEEGLRTVARILEMWPAEPFSYTHFFCGLRQARYLLYMGRAEDAWSRTSALEAPFRASGLHRAPYMKAHWLQVRGRVALARLAADPGRMRLEVESCVAQLADLGRVDCAGESAILQACLRRDDAEAVGTALDAALAAFRSERLLARVRSTEAVRAALDGPADAELRALGALGVAAPTRWLSLFAPGLAPTR